MTCVRPAGMSDEESDSEDEYNDQPRRKYNFANEVNEKTRIENTLQDAIINGNLNLVQNIIVNELKHNVNLKLDSGWTPLMHACFHGQEKIVKFLLSYDADPNLHTDSMTPIMAVCSNSSADNDTVYNIASDLIDKNCLLNIGDKYGQTPLMRAISSGRVAIVQKLLDMKVNIEMRDQQGWTALFWSVHHNQPEILEILIAYGARLTEVDKSNRKPMDIALSHDYENIIGILKKHLKPDESYDKDVNTFINSEMSTWYDFYPGVKFMGKPTYISEIPHLLYGMNCENVGKIIQESGMDLRTFLLLEDDDMIKLKIDMPYQRQRLKQGLRNFHKYGWKLNAVAGLYARKNENFTVLDCLSTLGSHIQQIYILEATLTYTLREYAKAQHQLKFESPESPLFNKMKTATQKMITNINNIRREIKNMKSILTRISNNNPQPADFIKEKSFQDVALGYAREALVFCSLGLVVYHARNYFTNMLTK